MKEIMIEVAKVLLAIAFIAILYVLGTKVAAYVQTGADKIPSGIAEPNIKVTCLYDDYVA